MKTVLAHEHLALSFFSPKVGRDESFAWTVASLRAAVANGVTEVWDLTNQTFGRDLRRLAAISQAAGVAVVASTGYYLDRFHPAEARSVSVVELARAWTRELNDSSNPIPIRIIGEIATGYRQATEQEEKALQAAAIAQAETGAPIYTHTTYGTLAMRQLDVLFEAGAVPSRVIVGHADVMHSTAEVLAVIERGAMVGIDTVGKETWQALDGTVRSTPDAARIELLRNLVDAGHSDRVVLSSDLLFERGELGLNPDTFGAHGYSYLPARFLPLLAREGFPSSTLESIAGANAARVLA